MGQERDAFLWIRSRLEASANIAATDIYWGFNQKPPENKAFAILLDDGGRVENEGTPKSGSGTKFFKCVVRVRLAVNVPSPASPVDTAVTTGLVTASTDILDRWADIEAAIGAGAEQGTGTPGVPTSYQDHRFGDVAADPVDDSFPGWRIRESVIEIDLAE